MSESLVELYSAEWLSKADQFGQLTSKVQEPRGMEVHVDSGVPALNHGVGNSQNLCPNCFD